MKRSKEEIKELRKVELKKRRMNTKRANDGAVNAEFEEQINSSSYYFTSDHRLRLVVPYYYTFKVSAKLRWENKRLVDMMLHEFQYKSPDEIIPRIHKGLVQVNAANVSEDYVIRSSDYITHRVHKHELPILDEPIHIAYEDDDKVIVNKPASIPVHPCGRYMLNSVIILLAKEMNYRNLRIVHRLDRMTSGLLIFAKTYETSLLLSQQIQDRVVSKFYVARVRGRFPHQLESVDKFAESIQTTAQPIVVNCHASIAPVSSKFGIRGAVSKEQGGQECHTSFVRVAYQPADDSSIVLCRLFTGRTHQIRVHLQYLGHPILDDPLYDTDVWGPQKGFLSRYTKSMEELVRDIESQHQHDHTSLKATCVIPSPAEVDPDCAECVRGVYEVASKDLRLYLHSVRYKSNSWDYSVPLPAWYDTLEPPNYDLLENVEDNASCVRIAVHDNE